MSSVSIADNLLTKEQACVFLNISAPTLDRWMRSGKVTASIKTGRIVRFSMEKLQEDLSRQPQQNVAG